MSDDKNSFQSRSERKQLVLALIMGMSGNAILSWLTMSAVPFSIFPWIALILSAQSLYQEYVAHPVSEDFPLVGLACFFVGAFGHSAFIKVQYPGDGSNFLAIIIVLVLMVWIAKKLGYWGRHD
jgi:hypothetical protein